MGETEKEIERNLPHCRSSCCRALVFERGEGLTLNAVQNSHSNTGHFDFCDFFFFFVIVSDQRVFC